MKHVNAFEIIGNPGVIEKTKHPHTGKDAVLLADGSIFCLGEYLAPEPTDGKLYEMRREFDKNNGLTPFERKLIANSEIMDAVKQGMTVFC
jgi:hypothetical protein